MRNRGLVLASALAIGACGGDGAELSDRTPGVGQPGDDLGSFDPGGSGPSGTPRGCEHIDLVFALDNSGSMKEEKQAMREVVFPAFAQKLSAIPTILDFRAAVLDGCPTPATFHTRGVAGECHFESGAVWMESDSSDLEGEFACVADIDSSGTECSGSNDDEQPASTVAAALEPPFSSGHNAGFLREEALLVVVAITDEDETPVPSQSAEEIRDRILKAKQSSDHVVFLGIAGEKDCKGVYGDADEAPMMKELAALFGASGQGLFWDLCAGGLEQGLAAALSTIEAACADLQPVR